MYTPRLNGDDLRILTKVLNLRYVELLERQQALLVSGVHELYRREALLGNRLSPCLKSSTNELGKRTVWQILEEIGVMGTYKSLECANPNHPPSKSSSLDYCCPSPSTLGESSPVEIPDPQYPIAEQLVQYVSDIDLTISPKSPGTRMSLQMVGPENTLLQSQAQLPQELDYHELDVWLNLGWASPSYGPNLTALI